VIPSRFSRPVSWAAVIPPDFIRHWDDSVKKIPLAKTRFFCELGRLN
jgi:hypothetical protein